MTEIKGELLSLKDTQLETENPAEDIRKHDVVDSAGEKVGHVSDLLVDDGERKVRLMEVAHGGLLGIGQEKVLIPVDAITKIDADVVHIDRSREHVAGAPVYDPDVGLRQDDYAGLYDYYGYAPFWGPGYAYPANRRL